MKDKYCEVYECDEETYGSNPYNQFCAQHSSMYRNQKITRFIKFINQRIDDKDFEQKLDQQYMGKHAKTLTAPKEIVEDLKLIEEVFSSKLSLPRKKSFFSTQHTLKTLGQKNYLKACKLSEKRINLRNPYAQKEN